MPIYDLHLPDKSEYLELIPTSQETPEMLNLIAKMLVRNEDFDSCRIMIRENQMSDFLQVSNDYPSLNFRPRKTVLFRSDLEVLCRKKNRVESLKISQVGLNSKDLPIFKDFMLNSFGVDFTEEMGVVENKVKAELLKSRFENAFKDNKNKHFLTSLDGNYIGTFSLVFLPETKQIQLHSVAGKASQSTNIYQKSNKFELLTRAIKYTLKNNSEGYTNLIFTCSKPKVVDLYIKSGFKVDKPIKVFELLLN